MVGHDRLVEDVDPNDPRRSRGTYQEVVDLPVGRVRGERGVVRTQSIRDAARLCS